MSNQPHIPTEPIQRQEERTLVDKGRAAVTKLANRLESLVVENVPIDTIYPNPYNPNRQSDREFDLLKLSIIEDGFTQPVIVQKTTRMIVDGEHRWKALTQLGSTIIPVVFVDMTDQQMRISTLRHNRARGSEDIELSIKILEDLRQLGGLDRAVNGLGISDDEISSLLSDLTPTEAMANDEYEQAWIPDKSADANTEAEFRAGSDRTVATSFNAKEALEDAGKKIDQAETNLQKAEASSNAHGIVRQISATFSNGDASTIRTVLGTTPAQRLIELCVAYILAHLPDFKDDIIASAQAIKAKWSSS